MYIPTLETETRRLEQIQSSRLIGICLLDSENELVSFFENDPALREMILEYQTQRVRELTLSQRTINSQAGPLPYPVVAD